MGSTGTEVGTREDRILGTLVLSVILEMFLSEVSADKLNFLVILTSPEMVISSLDILERKMPQLVQGGFQGMQVVLSMEEGMMDNMDLMPGSQKGAREHTMMDGRKK